MIKPIAGPKKKMLTAFICAGIVFMAAGAAIGMFTDNEDLSHRIVGFSSGFTGALGVCLLVLHIISKLNPDMAHRREISEKDERNIRIREKAAYSTFFVMLFALVFATFAFVCLNDFRACLITIGLTLAHSLCCLCFIWWHNKRI